MTAGTWDLTALVNAADPNASLPERHLWLIRLLEWLRHAPRAGLLPLSAGAGKDTQDGFSDTGSHSAWPLRRLQLLLKQLDQQKEWHAAVRQMAASFWRDNDAAALFADLGFGARRTFGNEWVARVQQRLLPGTPDTRDLGNLFALLFEPADHDWLSAIDSSTWQRLVALVGPEERHLRVIWLDAIAMVLSAVQAAGYSPHLRLRMDAALLRDDPFGQLGRALAPLRLAVLEDRGDDALRESAYLRALLDRCRQATQSVLPHLESHGISVNIVYDLDQVAARTARAEQLLGAVLSPPHSGEGRHLLVGLVQVLRELRGLRALFASHYSLLARQVTERSAETGEHYITRTRAEWLQMLRRAAGGGLVIAGTTFIKFALGALALTAFWAGFAAGVNYAASFVLVMLLHWTVATKQPAMTAPALAAQLPKGRSASDAEIDGFIERVAQLVRSQAAAIVGNVAVCAPVVLLVQGLSWAVLGRPVVGPEAAHHVLDSLTLLGPTALFAAFTGVLLFASSLVAGWAENWFVLHRLDSAIAWNPRIVQRLGAARAQRWAHWWRKHVSGLAANVSLGMMLGLMPPVLGFLGAALEVRHVTLASGQLGAALGALGPGLLAEPGFWWCVAGIAVTGVLNLSVSFGLAFAVALRSRGVQVQERSRMGAALWGRLQEAPLTLFWPPRS